MSSVDDKQEKFSNISKKALQTYKYCPTCKSLLILRNRHHEKNDNLKVLACSNYPKSCKFQFYNNPITVVGAIIEHQCDLDDSKVCLVRQKDWPKNWFGLVTGFLECNDKNPEEAIRREIQEELGLTNIIIENLVGIYPFHKMNELLIIYHCKTKGNINLDQNELAEYKLIPEKDVIPWNFGTGLAVKDWLEHRRVLYEKKLDSKL